MLPSVSAIARVAAPIVLAVLLTDLARAGSPTLCFEYDVGGARCVPAAESKVDSADLLREARAAFAESTDVLVHMETVRRVALRDDHAALDGLVATLRVAALDAEASDRDALTRARAWFDLGYACRVASDVGANPGGAIDGYLAKAAALAPADARIRFGLYMASAKRGARHDVEAFTHLAAALDSGAEQDALLWKNLRSAAGYYEGGLKEKDAETMKKSVAILLEGARKAATRDA